MKTVTITYFAVLREERGCDEERVSTDVATLDQLFDEIAAKHFFTVLREGFRVALNDEFVEWDSAFEDGAEIVFIPPVSGG